MAPKICICATQVPFTRGGAELLVESLHDELLRRGYDCDVVSLPFSWFSRSEVLRSALAWRLIDLNTLAGERIDLVIATRFPSYLIRHPNKKVWLIHQFRQVYDLLGTPFSDYGDSPEDRATIEMVRRMDNRMLGEARELYTISGNTADRLQRFNGLTAEPLYPPPKLGDACRPGDYGDYVFAVGRLDKMKRFDLLVKAMAKSRRPFRCLIAGDGPERSALAERIAAAGLGERVQLLGFVDDTRLAALYADCFAVYYAPFDEDYGYVTVEAMKAAKPVVTCADSGGVLEFVDHGKTGLVAPAASARGIAAHLDRLDGDRGLVARLGEAGRQRVAEIGWDRVVEKLAGDLPVPAAGGGDGRPATPDRTDEAAGGRR